MSITSAKILKLARSAEIMLTDEEVNDVVASIASKINDSKLLDEIDTTDVLPTFSAFGDEMADNDDCVYLMNLEQVCKIERAGK